WNKLAVDVPAEHRYRQHAAYIYRDLLGGLLAAGGRIREEEEAVRHALAMWEKLAADFPRESQYLSETGWTCRKLASLLARLPNRLRDAQEMHAKDVSIFEKLATEFSDNPFWLDQLAHGHRQWGGDLWNSGRPRDLEEAHRQGLSAHQKLV